MIKSVESRGFIEKYKQNVEKLSICLVVSEKTLLLQAYNIKQLKQERI